MALSNKLKLASCVAAPLLAVSVLEFTVSAFDAAPRRAAPLAIWNAARDSAVEREEEPYEFVRGWLWQPRPDSVADGVRVNELGFRGRSYPVAPRPELRIAVFGESVGFGMGVESDAKCWPQLVEERLRDRGIDAQVLNFSVIGHTLVQGIELHARFASRWSPDVVIACFGGINESARVSGQPIDSEKIALLDSSEFRVRQFLDRFDCVRWAAQLRGGHVDLASELGFNKAASRPRVSLELFSATLLRWKQVCADRKASFALVELAFSRDGEERMPTVLEYAAAVRRAAESEGIPLAAVRARFRAAEDTAQDVGRRSKLYVDAWHPSARGHAIYADAVLEALDGAGLTVRHAAR